jgi:ADP-ribosyl-[dinitrogen reductase] hydrolase
MAEMARDTNAMVPTHPLPATTPHVTRALEITPSLFRDRLDGLIIGLALGDSLGLPVETLTKQQITEEFGTIRDFLEPWRNSHIADFPDLKRGCYSDDAQLSIAMFDAFSEIGTFSIDAICRAHIKAMEDSVLGWGGSTLAGVKALQAGLTPDTPEFRAQLGSGTGNGIPMKSAALAAWCVATKKDPLSIGEQVRQLCSISHPNSNSVTAGLVHVAGLHYCLTHTPDSFAIGELMELLIQACKIGSTFYCDTAVDDVLLERISAIPEAMKIGDDAIIDAFGGGSCSVIDSLPFSYAFFLRSPFEPQSLYRVIEAGGDTDSNGAIVGALQGALFGASFYEDTLTQRIVGLETLRAKIRTFADVMLQQGGEK